MIKILELLEGAYPRFYHAEELRKKVKMPSLDGEFSQVLRYLKDTRKIDIVFPESRMAPTGRYKLALWLMKIDEVTITPSGIDFLFEIKSTTINEQRTKATTKATIVLASAALVQIILYIISKDFTLNITSLSGAISILILLLITIYLIGIMASMLLSALFPEALERWNKWIKSRVS